MKTTIHNKAIAARFKELRTQHLKLTAIQMAEAIGVSQSRISKIESAGLSVPNSIITILVTKFDVNRDWLLDKVGQPIDKKGKKSSLVKAMTLQDTVDGLKTEVLILSKNLNKAWEIIERLNRDVESIMNKK